MFDQLDIVEERYEQLNEMLSDPEIVNDSDKLRKYSKEQADLQKQLMYIEIIKVKKEEIAEIDEMLNETEDKEEIEMLKEESASLKSAIPELEEQLKFLLIPKDLMMRKTLSLKSEQQQVEMKRQSSLAIY